MIAITIDQPHVWAVVYGSVRLINMKWSAPSVVNKQVALCSSQKSYDQQCADLMMRFGVFDHRVVAEFPFFNERGVIQGLARVVGIHPYSNSAPAQVVNSPLCSGPYVWEFANVIQLTKPVSMQRVSTGSWKLSVDAVELIKNQDRISVHENT